MIAKGTRVLVTGATGFIGGRLVERLSVEHGANVQALVRNFARAPRIARFPITMVPGEVTNAPALDRAMEGCDLVFHCAFGSSGTPGQQRETTITGTRNVLEAALRHSVKRVVHVSTVSVYGRTTVGDLDESAPRRRTGELYADSKRAAEALAFKYFRTCGLPVSVVQPTIVYGPYGGTWTVGPLTQLKSHRVVLVDGGRGLCNAVYVDDVVQAILLAAVREESIGQAFLVSGKEPVTWQEFWAAYENMLGFKSTISLSPHELATTMRHYRKSQSTVGQLRTGLRNHPEILQAALQLPAIHGGLAIGSRFTPAFVQRRAKDMLLDPEAGPAGKRSGPTEKPILPLTNGLVHLFRSHTRVRIDKATRLLGYRPSFDFERGMKLTEMWARYSGLCQAPGRDE